MKTFVEAETGHLYVYSDTFRYIGFLVKSDGVWGCQRHPGQRMDDLPKDVVEGVDEILEVLNQ